MTQAQTTSRIVEAPVGIKDGLAGRNQAKRPKKVHAPAGTPTVAAQAEAVLKAFNTWAYKREQPSCADRLRDVVPHAVERRAPLPFVLYWGKGPRTRIAAPDLACLDYLDSMAARIRAVYDAGASIRLILTDTHARLNGHAVAAADAYFADVAEAAAARGFATVRLGALVATAADHGRPEADTAPTGAVPSRPAWAFMPAWPGVSPPPFLKTFAALLASSHPRHPPLSSSGNLGPARATLTVSPELRRTARLGRAC